MTKHKKQNKQQIDTNPSGNRQSYKTWLIAILFIHVVLAIIYWHLTPFGLPPDEGPHGKYVNALVDNRSLLTFNPSDRDNYEFHQPPLYYLMAIPFLLIGRVLGMGDPAVFIRLLSMILGGLSIYVIYRAIETAFRNSRLAIACAGFAALLPTHSMLSSSVSNDVLTELVFGLLLLITASMFADNLTWRKSIYAGLILGAGLLTKTNCMILFPVAGFAYLLLAYNKKIAWKDAFAHFGSALGISLIIGGWWLVRNTMLYGDPFGLSIFQQAFQHTAKPEFFFRQGATVFQYLEIVATWTFASFWGVFGHMKIFMPNWVYILMAVITIPFTAISLVSLQRDVQDGSRNFYIISMVTYALVLLSFLMFNMSFFQAQGRYLYPALIPISLLWCYGISKKISPLVIYGIMILIQIVAISCII